MGQFDCAIKGLAYQFLDAQSIIFGKEMKRTVQIVHIHGEAEFLGKSALTDLLNKAEKHEGSFMYEGGVGGGWMDDPGLDMCRLQAQFTIVEAKE